MTLIKPATRDRLHAALRNLPPDAEGSYLDPSGDSFSVTRKRLPRMWFITQLSGHSFTDALVDLGSGTELTTMAVSTWAIRGRLVLRKDFAVAVRPDAARVPNPVPVPGAPRAGFLKQALWMRRAGILDVTDEEVRGLIGALSRAITMQELVRRHLP